MGPRAYFVYLQSRVTFYSRWGPARAVGAHVAGAEGWRPSPCPNWYRSAGIRSGGVGCSHDRRLARVSPLSSIVFWAAAACCVGARGLTSPLSWDGNSPLFAWSSVTRFGLYACLVVFLLGTRGALLLYIMLGSRACSVDPGLTWTLAGPRSV